MTSSPQRFALHVVERLQRAGYLALWAGGCVRDRLLQRVPKDYDVATNATPEEIRRLFRKHRTLMIGASFGVVVVVGPRAAGNVEVATFRSDSTYSDGRHPDRVTFSSPEEDARRRDFTINGLFYDPIRDDVLDYVGGQEDLHAGIIRAIGDPRERISEDKLRMLRAVRFAAHFQFALEPRTKEAVHAQADAITLVSAERIAEELRRILVDANRGDAVRLLAETGLLPRILPEAKWLSTPPDDAAWHETLRTVDALEGECFATALAALIRHMHPPAETMRDHAERICRRLRLANHETDLATWLLAHEGTIRSAARRPWSEIQPILVTEGIDELLRLSAAVTIASGGDLSHVRYCRQRLLLPADELDPAPLITGDDLIAHGLAPGRKFAAWLSAVREAQLEQRISNREQALALVDQLLRADAP
jgi:tRNA nucleotidyltransferase/poly(A) polymerase